MKNRRTTVGLVVVAAALALTGCRPDSNGESSSVCAADERGATPQTCQDYDEAPADDDADRN